MFSHAGFFVTLCLQTNKQEVHSICQVKASFHLLHEMFQRPQQNSKLWSFEWREKNSGIQGYNFLPVRILRKKTRFQVTHTPSLQLIHVLAVTATRVAMQTDYASPPKQPGGRGPLVGPLVWFPEVCQKGEPINAKYVWQTNSKNQFHDLNTSWATQCMTLQHWFPLKCYQIEHSWYR